MVLRVFAFQIKELSIQSIRPAFSWRVCMLASCFNWFLECNISSPVTQLCVVSVEEIFQRGLDNLMRNPTIQQDFSAVVALFCVRTFQWLNFWGSFLSLFLLLCFYQDRFVHSVPVNTSRKKCQSRRKLFAGEAKIMRHQ